MALPVDPEDLQKLKTFIDFVSTNPTILNFPQLAFVKQFIEKFGGKVPSGEYKMPAGCGCPFGGDGACGVKAEPKPAQPEEAKMESDSESELELDMEVAFAAEKERDTSKSPNAVYLQETIESNKKKIKKKKSTTRCQRAVVNSSRTCSMLPKTKHEEPTISEDEALDINMEYESCNESDPIDTAAEVIIKMESDFEEFEELVKNDCNVNDNDEDFDDDNDNDENYHDDENESDSDNMLVESPPRKKTVKKPRANKKQRNVRIKSENNDDENDDNDSDDSDKELKLTKRSIQKLKSSKNRRNTRSRKSLKSAGDKDFWQSLLYKKKKKQPKPINCTDKCKHKCHRLKICEAQRRAMCSEYWGLSKEERKNYLLDYVESRHISKIRAKSTSRISKGYTNVYFLKNNEGSKVRVCLNFFQRTFCITNNVIKSATEHRDRSEIKKSVSLKNKAAKARAMKTQHNENCEEEVPELSIERLNEPLEIETQQQEEAEEVEHHEASGEVETSGNTSGQPKPNTNKGKKLKKDRVPQPVKCDEICIMKCTQNFTEAQRVQICQHFWTMDYKRQKDFVLSKIETRDVESLTAEEYRTSTRAKRTFSNRYYFKGPRGNNVRVCANFFMATLCIGRHVINNALKYADRQTGSYAGEDRRGKHIPGNKIPDDMVADMKLYVESYPTWVPHKNYKTRFLDSSLTIQQMWRDYKKIREAEGRKYCSASFFRHNFHKEHRLAFLKPSSKHAQKVSAMKKDVFLSRSDQKKTNTNISEFTGEEGGGYWIKPNGEIIQQSTPYVLQQRVSDATAAATASTAAAAAAAASSNVPLHIQENVQIHAPQTTALPLQTSVVNSSPYYASTSYAQPMVNPQQIHGSNLNMHSYIGGSHRYDEEQQQQQQQLAVFRML